MRSWCLVLVQAAADLEACWQDLNVIWQQLAHVRQLQQAWADFVTGYIDQVSLALQGGKCDIAV